MIYETSNLKQTVAQVLIELYTPIADAKTLKILLVSMNSQQSPTGTPKKYKN